MKTICSVLIVDDNPGDVEIATYFLRASGRYRHIYSVTDGQEALELFLDYEASRARFPDTFPPILILLDINMPRLDGFGFLKRYAALARPRSDPAVVVMLTSSQYQPDVERAAGSELVKKYIVKPLTRDHGIELAEAFGNTDASGAANG